MRKLTTGRVVTVLVFGLILAVAVPILGPAPTVAAAPAGRVKVVALPLANNTEVGGDELAGRVHQALQLTLAASDRASLINLRPSSPAVRRAMDVEMTLDPGDLDIVPPANRSQAERIGRALGADIVLWGSIDEYTWDEAGKQVTIGLSIQKLDLAAEQVSTVALTGKSAAKVGFDAGEGPLMTEAIDDAVTQVVQQVLGVSIVAAPRERPAAPAIGKKKDKTWQTIGALLAAAAVIALASDGGGGAAPPVVQPGIVSSATAIPTADAVELSWEVAPTATSITSFNIYRAEMGASRAGRVRRAPQSRVRLTRQASGYSLLANVGRSDRIYTDISANTGTLYAYRMSAVVGGSESTPVDFYNYYEQLRGAVGIVEVGPAWPTAPAMPTARNGVGAVEVQWAENPEPFIDSYRLYRSTSADGPWDSSTLRTELAPAAGTLTFNDMNVVGGTTYFYAVGAVTAATGVNGRVGASLRQVFTPGTPMPPSDVRAEPRIAAVVLTWTASPDATGYRVFRNGAQIAQVGSTVTTYTDSPLDPGSYTYAVASIAGSPVVESDRIPAVPSPISPSNPPAYLLTSPPNPAVVANGVSTVDLYAFARDAADNPVAGIEIVFSLTVNGGTLVPHPDYPATAVPAGLRVITDANGKTAVRFQAGTDPSANPEVTVLCEGVDAVTMNITLLARQIAAVTLAAEYTMLAADGQSSTTLTAAVLDQGGGGMPDVTVQFASLAPTIGIVSPTSAVTGADGTAVTTLTSAGTATGPCTVTATAVGAPAGTPAAQVTVQFVGAPRVTVSVDPHVIPAGGLGSTALITATAKFANGMPVQDGTVIRFGFEGGDSLSTTGATIAAGRERALTQDGVAYSTLISAPDLVNGDSDVVWAWLDINDDGVWDGPPEMLGSTVVTYTDPPYRITLTAEPLSIPADGRSVSKIVADVRTNVPDPSAGGYRPVADGTLVEFVTSKGKFVDSGTLQTSGRTIGGLVTVFLTAPTQTGTATITGTAALVSGSTEVQFTAPVNTVISVVASPATLQANGQDQADIIVRVQDNEGKPKVGVSVDIYTDLGTLAEDRIVTDENGDATTTFTAGITAGTASVVAKSGGATGFVTLTLTSGLAQNVSMVILAPNGVMPATNGTTSPSGASPTATVYARVTDKHGNPVVDGTPVFFHTDIGQVDGSALTEDGLAEATLVTGSFLDATNKATYRPGWASITSYAGNPAGPATAGPEYQIFCGNIAAYNWDGSANDTDLWTDFGGDWRLRTTGSSNLAEQPNLVPKAGDPIWATAILADQNNNPLPSGVPLTFTFTIGSTVVATVSTTTTMYHTYSGVKYCGAEASATVTSFPDQVTAALLDVNVYVPSIIDTYWDTWPVYQYVGAAGPSGTIELTLDPPETTVFPEMTVTVLAHVFDEFGNPVQDDNPVFFEVQDPDENIASVDYNPDPAFTTGGQAVTTMTVHVIDPAAPANFTISVGSPQGPPDADAVGTLAVNVNAVVVP
ncbi:MAG: Ig-like domain-containing protein [Armatimonadota bacterium]|nr:MAG: Ig-like domain-containing protein [Armatimonadota bacterium]